MKKALIIIFICYFFIPFKVLALNTNAKSSILMEATTKTILFEENKDEPYPMASMTKMMSLLLFMEAIDNGKLKYDDKVLISERAASMGGSQIYLEAGTYMDVSTLLKSIFVASANDSTVALAEHLSGSVEDFVNKMNEKASSLGLKNTVFKNPHGLDDEGHYSSSYDLALIASELVKYPDIFNYTTIYEDYIKHENGSSTWIVNTNKLINYYPGLDGLKTGYTEKALYGITATAKRGNLRLISVVMGEETNKIRNEDTIALLNYGFNNYKTEKILDLNKSVGDIDIKFGKKNKIKMYLKEDVLNLVNNNDKSTYSYDIIKKNIKAPINKNDIIGKLILSVNGVKVREYNLYSQEEIKKANIFDLLRENILRFLRGYY